MSTTNKQYSLLSISISDCQEILNFNKFTPEDVVDLLFSKTRASTLSKSDFLVGLQAAMSKNAVSNPKFSVEDICLRVFDVCAQGSSSITVE